MEIEEIHCVRNSFYQKLLCEKKKLINKVNIVGRLSLRLKLWVHQELYKFKRSFGASRTFSLCAVHLQFSENKNFDTNDISQVIDWLEEAGMVKEEWRYSTMAPGEQFVMMGGI